jgi:hypothetical protein
MCHFDMNECTNRTAKVQHMIYVALRPISKEFSWLGKWYFLTCTARRSRNFFLERVNLWGTFRRAWNFIWNLTLLKTHVCHVVANKLHCNFQASKRMLSNNFWWISTMCPRRMSSLLKMHVSMLLHYVYFHCVQWLILYVLIVYSAWLWLSIWGLSVLFRYIHDHSEIRANASRDVWC